MDLIDNFISTLTVAYTAGGTSLTVNTTVSLPSGACDFFVIVQAEGGNTTEVFRVSNVNTGTKVLTVVGAQANTGASNHSIGAAIIASILTVKSVYPSLTPPVQADWNNPFNTAGMVQAPTFVSSRWEFSSNAGASANLQGIARALPAVPYKRVFRIWAFQSFRCFGGVSVGFADGAVGTPGKLAVIGVASTGAAVGATGVPVIFFNNYTNVTTFNSSITPANGFTGFQVGFAANPIFIRVGDDNTNWTWDVSFDGINFVNMMTEARNTFLTATQLVICVDCGGSNQASKVVFDSYYPS